MDPEVVHMLEVFSGELREFLERRGAEEFVDDGELFDGGEDSLFVLVVEGFVVEDVVGGVVVVVIGGFGVLDTGSVGVSWGERFLVE